MGPRTSGVQRLKKAGFRPTQAREAVLHVLEKAKRPLSHHEVLRELKAGAFDRVTVYRTLETLQKTGLLHRIQGTDGVWRYCGHKAPSEGGCLGNHIHFLCSKCGRMSCLPEQPLPWVTAPRGAKILSKQLVVHGLCAPCASKRRLVPMFAAVIALAVPAFVRAASGPPPRAEVIVSAAASLKDVLGAMAPEFEKKNPDLRLTFNFGGSGQLRMQIEGGAPADVFISAAASDMDALEKKDILVPDTRETVARNALVLIRNRASHPKVSKSEDLAEAAVSRISIGNPATVPAGRYAKETLEKRGLLDKLQAKLIFAENVRQVLDYVARGEVDAGFVYRTDAMVEPKVEIVEIIPSGQHSPIVYPAAVLKTGINEAGARALVKFLRSRAGRKAFKKNGFE